MSGADPKAEITRCMAACPDFPDFPAAWAIQKAYGAELKHRDRCSSVPGWDPLSGPAFLCDCGAVEQEWWRLKKEGQNDEA